MRLLNHKMINNQPGVLFLMAPFPGEVIGGEGVLGLGVHLLVIGLT